MVQFGHATPPRWGGDETLVFHRVVGNTGLVGTIASGYATRNQRANLQRKQIQVELAVRGALQGYLAHKKTQPPRTLP